MSIIRLGNLWHPSNMYLKHTSATLSTFDKMDYIFIILDWRRAGGICVFAVFSKYCKPSLLPSLWGSHTYRCRYCHRLTSGHITPSPSYHIPPPPYHHHSDILCHHHYNTINRLSYTTTTIPPSPWHHKPSYSTIPSQSHTATVFFKYDLFLCRLPPWANFPAVVIHLTLSPYRPRRLVRQDFTIATNGKLYGDCQFSFIGDGLLKVNFTGNKVNITQISPCNVLDTFYNAMYLISPSGLMQWGKVHWNVSILI